VWTDHSKPQFVSLGYAELSTWKCLGWSGRFKIEQVDELSIKIVDSKANKSYYPKVVISMDGNTVYVRIQNQDTNNPPYMINNLTTYDINFRQKPNEGNKTFTDTDFRKCGPN